MAAEAPSHAAPARSWPRHSRIRYRRGVVGGRARRCHHRRRLELRCIVGLHMASVSEGVNMEQVNSG